jgi:hypothetical protein
VRELIAAVDVGGSIGFNDFIEFYTPDERRSIALERRIPGAVEHAMFAHAREFTVTPTEEHPPRQRGGACRTGKAGSSRDEAELAASSQSPVASAAYLDFEGLMVLADGGMKPPRPGYGRPE